MQGPESPIRIHDLARAAALLLDAVDGAPGQAMQTVETCYGRADVVLDGQAVDVVLQDRNATVHVRFNASATAG